MAKKMVAILTKVSSIIRKNRWGCRIMTLRIMICHCSSNATDPTRLFHISCIIVAAYRILEYHTEKARIVCNMINRKLIIILFSIIVVVIILVYRENKLDVHIKEEPLFDKQWYLMNNGTDTDISDAPDYTGHFALKKGFDISAKEMWKLFSQCRLNNKEIIIALLDTGVDYSHEDLANSMWVNKGEIPDDGIDNDKNGYIDDVYGYDFCNDTHNLLSFSSDEAENQHGTMCAGIICASKNMKGIIGVAYPAKVKIMSLKVLKNKGDELEGRLEDILSAIQYAEKNGALICNMSFSFAQENKDLAAAIKKSKMLFVVSAGNSTIGIDIDQNPSYPGAYTFNNLITVANANYNGHLNNRSNYGDKSVDVAAPGTSVITTSLDNHYAYGTGSSFSAPIVTGIAAMLARIKVSEDLTAQEIKKIILSSTIKNRNMDKKLVSGGVVDGFEALKYLVENYDCEYELKKG